MRSTKGENRAEFQGRILSGPEPSHRNHGVEYDQLELAVPRLSGTQDVLRLLASRSLLERWTPRPEQWVSVTGEVRSYNNKSGAGSRLVITVLARTIQPEAEGEGVNHLRLAGVLCKTPVVRRTPLGRDICDLLLAVNRKVVILIPLCFVLTHFLGFKGVYLSEGIADLVAGIVTAIVIFTSFPKIFRRREEKVKQAASN